MNMEGSIEGPNGNLTVLGTLTGEPSADAQNGTYTWLGREFAADDEIPADDMYVEALEELLPQLLDAVTPRRVEQARVLIF